MNLDAPAADAAWRDRARSVRRTVRRDAGIAGRRGVADPALPSRRRGLPGPVVALREPGELPRAPGRARRARRAAARCARRGRRGGRGRGARRSSTFDDGYADFADAALPGLRGARHSGDAVRRERRRSTAAREFWWDELERIVHRAGARCRPSLGDRPRRNAVRVDACDRWRPARALPRASPAHRTARGRGADRRCSTRSRSGPASRPGCRPTHRPLDAATLAAVARDPRITIGAHTVSHSYLGALPLDEQEREIAGSKRTLEAIVGASGAPLLVSARRPRARDGRVRARGGLPSSRAAARARRSSGDVDPLRPAARRGAEPLRRGVRALARRVGGLSDARRRHAMAREAQRCPRRRARWLRAQWDARRVGAARSGSCASGACAGSSPISREYGFDRGRRSTGTTSRRSSRRHAADVAGDVLEIKDDGYTRRFGGARVRPQRRALPRSGRSARDDRRRSGRGRRTIPSGDVRLRDRHARRSQLIYDVRSALATIHRVLKPGGVLLATVPGMSQTSPHADWGERWAWGFTRVSAREPRRGGVSRRHGRGRDVRQRRRRDRVAARARRPTSSRPTSSPTTIRSTSSSIGIRARKAVASVASDASPAPLASTDVARKARVSGAVAHGSRLATHDRSMALVSRPMVSALTLGSALLAARPRPAPATRGARAGRAARRGTRRRSSSASRSGVAPAVHRLANPPRVYVDLPDTTLAAQVAPRRSRARARSEARAARPVRRRDRAGRRRARGAVAVDVEPSANGLRPSSSAAADRGRAGARRRAPAAKPSATPVRDRRRRPSATPTRMRHDAAAARRRRGLLVIRADAPLSEPIAEPAIAAPRRSRRPRRDVAQERIGRRAADEDWAGVVALYAADMRAVQRRRRLGDARAAVVDALRELGLVALGAKAPRARRTPNEAPALRIARAELALARRRARRRGGARRRARRGATVDPMLAPKLRRVAVRLALARGDLAAAVAGIGNRASPELRARARGRRDPAVGRDGQRRARRASAASPRSRPGARRRRWPHGERRGRGRARARGARVRRSPRRRRTALGVLAESPHPLLAARGDGDREDAGRRAASAGAPRSDGEGEAMRATIWCAFVLRRGDPRRLVGARAAATGIGARAPRRRRRSAPTTTASEARSTRCAVARRSSSSASAR